MRTGHVSQSSPSIVLVRTGEYPLATNEQRGGVVRGFHDHEVRVVFVHTRAIAYKPAGGLGG